MTARGEGRPAVRRLGRAPTAPARASRRTSTTFADLPRPWERADPRRARPADPAVRHRAGRPRHRRRGRWPTASGRSSPRSRFGIPALVHEECLTGLAAWQATVFPAPLSWGASFDPDARRADGRRDRRHHGARSASTRGWPRCSTSPATCAGAGSRRPSARTRTWSATIGSAYVRGLQSAGVIATLKHFVGYSASRAGRNLAPVSAGPARDRRRAAAAVRDGAARAARAR